MNHVLAPSPTSTIEYLIYTYDFPVEGKRASSRWSRYAALADEELARAQAQILSDTHKYRRIEVKKKYFDSRRGRAVDTTLCVYEQGVERRRANMLGFIMGAGVMLAVTIAIIAIF